VSAWSTSGAELDGPRDVRAMGVEAPPDRRLEVWVVVPACDEEARIARVIETMPSRVARILLVDDGSHDDTVARAEAVRDPRLRVLRHVRRRGVGAAIESGYRCAFDEGAGLVVVMAGDAQMDPADLEALIAPVLDGRAGYTKGNRLDHPRAARDMPVARRLAGHVLSALTSAATRRRVRDSQCGYTAIDRASWARLSGAPLWPSYGYPNDVLVRLARARVVVRDVPVRPVYLGKRGGMGARHALLLVPYVIARAIVRGD
jgi:glycosyltransferase involved in cell wall biosynthesis